MSEPAAISRLTVVLAFGYPILAHVAIARDSVALTIAAVALLAVVALLPALARGNVLAWLGAPFIAAGCWWLSRTSIPVLPLYLAPVLVPAFLGWVFGHTLLSGRTPLIARLIRLLHAGGDEPPDAVWPYARGLTLAWTILFAVLATLNLSLALLAQPGGLLLAGGVAPPISVPQRWWSLFANVISYLLIAAFFIIEYAYRRRRFPQQPYRNMLDFLRRMLAAMPRLFEGAQ